MSEFVYPPLGSIIIAILTILLFFRRQPPLFIGLRNFSIEGHYLDDDAVEIRKYEFNSEMTCSEIGDEISKKYRDVIWFAKDLGANSLKRLIDCNLLEFETAYFKDRVSEPRNTTYDTVNTINTGNSVAFLHEFADWSTLQSDHPDVFIHLSNIVEIDQMTSQALKSFPIPLLVQKIKKLNAIVKLPMKQIFTEIIKTLENNTIELPPSEYFNFWKLFNSSNYSQLDSLDQILFMKYISLLGLKFTGEDFLLWLVKSEGFLVSSLLELQDYSDNVNDGFQNTYYSWMDKYSDVESIVNHFINSRLVLKRSFEFPISKILRISLMEASIGVSKASDLTEILMEPKPIDSGNYEIEKSEPTNFSKMFRKLYNPAAIFSAENKSFKEFVRELMVEIENPFLLLELLKCYSSNEKEIMLFIEAGHEQRSIVSILETSDILKTDNSLDTADSSLTQCSTLLFVYDEQRYVVEWIQLAFKMKFPSIANFFIKHYSCLISTDLSDIVLQAKSDGTLLNAYKFYWHPDTGMEMRAALMKRPTSDTMTEKNLLIDFFDFDEGIQLLTTSEALNAESESGKLKRGNNQKIRRVLKESFDYFLGHREELRSYKIAIIFKEMAGQDTGGLARHYVSLILRLLVDEEFGLFHRLPDTNLMVPRTLLDANVMGFVGMLHGQCLKLGIKAPWLLDDNLEKMTITLFDLLKEISRESNGIPSFEDILVYVNEKYKLFEDRFDFSQLQLSSVFDEEIESIARNIELAYRTAGITAYRDNLLRSLDPKVFGSEEVKKALLWDVYEIIKPFEFDDETGNGFLDRFEIVNEDVIDRSIACKVREAIKLALSSMRKSLLIPKILKFVTGSSAVSTNSTLFFINIIQIHDTRLKRLARSSTCTKTLFWTVEGRESVEEMKEKFLMAVLGSQGFDLI